MSSIMVLLYLSSIASNTWSLWSWLLEVLLQAPFAAARSLLIEHGFGDVLIAAHGHLDLTSRAHPPTIQSSPPGLLLRFRTADPTFTTFQLKITVQVIITYWFRFGVVHSAVLSHMPRTVCLYGGPGPHFPQILPASKQKWEPSFRISGFAMHLPFAKIWIIARCHSFYTLCFFGLL